VRFRDFRLERYFAEWEFSAKILLGSSDPESMRLPELLALADEDGRRRWEDLWLGYTESPGLPALREALAGQFAGCGPEDVLVFSAPEEAIFHVAAGVLEPGDHMVGITPAYQSSYEIPRSVGAQVTLVPLREDRGWTLDTDELAAALTARTRLIYVNFPHNPTGAMLSAAGQRRVVELADSCGAYLFSDEVYRGLEVDPADRLPAAADLYPRAISLGGLSKVYGLGGVRLGWTVCRDAGLNQRMQAAKDYTTICASAPSEVLALIAVRAADRLIGRSLDGITRNLALVDEFMRRRADAVRWIRPRGGSIGFPELLIDMPVATFCEQLVREHGVLLIPGGMFEVGTNHFRLGLGRVNLPAGLAALESFMDELDSGAGAGARP
jgi:aspartate/methionine/tyrosine aminotransferase